MKLMNKDYVCQTEYMKSIRNLLDIVVDFNKKGKQFPLWTTCLGYEAMLLSMSNFTLKRIFVNSRNHSLPFIPTEKFFSVLTRRQLEYSSNEYQENPYFYFNHKYAFTKE